MVVVGLYYSLSEIRVFLCYNGYSTFMFFTWVHWEFLYSKAISQRCIDIRVVLELAKKSARIIAEENIRSGLNG